MTKYFLTPCIVLIVAFCSNLCVAQGINWQTDLEQASQQAARENKLVLLHFGASWCRPCHALETYVFTNPRVHRAMQDNVIPVKIDVDEKPILVKEYGVSSVPYDVVITPAGRVVAKRSSPRNASAYADMITGLNRVINGLANGNPALHEQLDQLKDQMFTDNQIVENKSFEPAMPVHKAPSASRDSAELERKSRIINPFSGKRNEIQSQIASAPKTIKNNQFAQPSAPAKILNPMALASTTIPKTSKPDNNDFGGDGSSNGQNDRVAKVTPLSPVERDSVGAKLSAMANPTISKDFQPKSKLPTESPAAPAQMVTTKKAGNSFVPQPVTAAPPTDFTPGNSLNSTPTNDLLASTVSSATSKTKQIQTAKQTGFLPTDNKANGAQPIATVKLQTGTADTIRNPVSASLVIPESKPVELGSKNLLNDKTAEKMDVVPPQSQIVLEATSNDFAPTEPSSRMSITPQVAAHAPAKNSAMKTELPENVALHGKCPITLLKHGKWTDGDPKWGCIHRNRLYLFTSESNMREFKTDPDANSPLLAGYDPVIFRNSGELVDGDESHGVFMGKSPNQRVVLFSSAKTRAEFESNPKNYIETIRQAMQAAGGASSKLLR